MPYIDLSNLNAKRPSTTDLEGKEYILNHRQFTSSERVFKDIAPEQIIIAMPELKNGSVLLVDDTPKLTKEEKDELKKDCYQQVIRYFHVDHICDLGDELVIEAVGKPYLPLSQEKMEKKAELLRKIAPRIDFSNEALRKKLAEILSLVFLPEQLENMLKIDQIEVLLFDNLMYLKVGDKAYRL